MAYKHLFFDWDHTLWDFEANSRSALTSIYYEFDLRKLNVQSPDHFIDTYLPINYQMWTDYREGKIDAPTVKIKRFQDTLKHFGSIDNHLVSSIKDNYLQNLPLGGKLMPNVNSVLEYLSEKYLLHIVTNGFREITDEKLKYCGIAHYFTSTLAADEAGALKPNPIVFSTALKNNKATVEESLFIGDNLIADIQGAQAFGMDQVFFNPEKKEHQEQPTYEISDLSELVNFL